MTAARTRKLLVLVLAVNSGATDAIGFLALGGAFTSVMTGNLVLFGVSLAHGAGALLWHTLAAIAAYVVGCGFGSAIAGTPAAGDPVWPPAVQRALLVQTGVVAVYAVGWWASGSDPSSGTQLVLLALNAAALGIQSSAVLRFGVPGLSTTYLTGTLTTLVSRIAARRFGRDVALSAAVLAALVTGAAAGALLVRHARPLVPVIELGCLTLVVLSGR
ncbi:MAG TPA: DUF1275 family protein, partial [Asanoa sp.]|nr:DUF1275 family protein [Asanoa sp.]